MPTRFELRFCVGHPPMIIDMVGFVGLRYDGSNRNCLRPAIFAPAYDVSDVVGLIQQFPVFPFPYIAQAFAHVMRQYRRQSK